MNDFHVFGDDEALEKAALSTAKKRFSRCGLAMFAYIAVALGLSVLTSLLLPLFVGETALAENVYFTWAISVLPMYVFGLPILYLIVRDMKVAPSENKILSFKEFAVYFLISRFFIQIGSLASSLITGSFQLLTGKVIEDTTSDLITSSPLWLIVIVVVVLAPVVEELIFRKLILDRIRFYGDKVAILFTAIAFGLFHGNFYQFLYAFLLGLILGYVTVKTGNWLYAVMLHMITNFLGSVVSLPILDAMNSVIEFAETFDSSADISAEELLPYAQAMFSVMAFSAVSLGLVIAGAVLFFKNRKKITLAPATLWIPKEKTFATVALNVGVILFFLICAAEFVMTMVTAA